MGKILVIEDHASMREMLASVLAGSGYQVKCAANAGQALSLIEREFFSLILSDLNLPDLDGLSFCRRVRDLDIPFIILTAFGSIETAVKAMKEGAFDFLTKPVDPEHLLLVVEKALRTTSIIAENTLLKQNSPAGAETPIIGGSESLRLQAEKIGQVAATDLTVLLLGESGTGKELFARALHDLSHRRNKPFLAVNSAAIPEALLENELFGHEKGSYTGAHQRQAGKLQLAQGGTFFFDEIGEFPLHLQGKLLRILEEKQYQRIGGLQVIDLDLRFIFASNRDLEKECRAGRFRQDLYFRINVFPIELPPLRERHGDISLLAEFFCARAARNLRRMEMLLSPQALEKLSHYHWPGNVRELQNVIERAVIIAPGDRIGAGEIVLPQSAILSLPEPVFRGGLKEVGRQGRKFAETTRIKEALAESSGNKARAARLLGVSYRTLLGKLKEYGLAG